MPYVLSAPIHGGLPPLWGEGVPYATQTLYDRRAGEPPVRYAAHTLKPHSMAHLDAPAHTLPDGKTVEALFAPDSLHGFYGPAWVIQLANPRWAPVEGRPDTWHWEIAADEIQGAVARITGQALPPDKLILGLAEPAAGQSPRAPGAHYAMTLSPEAAEWLLSNPRFDAFGTSYQSVDFQPGRSERPIHAALFAQAAIFECLDLAHVPEGQYFFVAFPLRLAGASEAPVCPVLFERHELTVF